ncbi:MAG: hypothetical protein WC341_07740, partial [Bacteroidales bacterium]
MAFTDDVFIRIVADAKGFVAGFNEATKTVDEFQGKMKSSTDVLSLQTDKIRETEQALKGMKEQRQQLLLSDTDPEGEKYAQMTVQIQETEKELQRMKDIAAIPPTEVIPVDAVAKVGELQQKLGELRAEQKAMVVESAKAGGFDETTLPKWEELTEKVRATKDE